MEEKNKNRKNGRGYALVPRSVMVIFCYAIPALLVAALIAVGVWGSGNSARAEELRRTNEGIYRQAYTELADSVYNMQIALSKLSVCQTPSALSETLDDIRFESGAIAALMGRIPQSHAESYELNRFLIQIGDYAKSLSNALRRGGKLSDEDRGQLLEAFTASEAVFGEISEKLSSGNIPLSALDANAFFAQTEQGEEAGSRYPKLAYGGPFSDSMENCEPLGLSGEEVDDGTANTAALGFLEDDGAELEYGGVSGGRIPFHGFSGTLSDGRRAEIALSVTGGRLLYLRKDGGEAQSGFGTGESVSGQELSRLENAGKAWLMKMGYPETVATGVQYYETGVLISFAAVQRAEFTFTDGGPNALVSDDADMSEALNALRSEGVTEQRRVILYGDIVRLWLSRESGEVIGADANGYLFSHRERELPRAVMSEESLAAKLCKNLAVEKREFVLIPLPDGSERLCCEFTGSFAGESYAVYLDAETGEEVRVSRVINDEHGRSML